MVMPFYTWLILLKNNGEFDRKKCFELDFILQATLICSRQNYFKQLFRALDQRGGGVFNQIEGLIFWSLFSTCFFQFCCGVIFVSLIDGVS
jgi:hypothetical protein